MQPGALEGIRVIDLSQMIAGPYCTQMLGDLGADVIKVEDPRTAPSRRAGRSPQVEAEDGSLVSFGAFWLGTNRNKRSLTLDLRSAAGKEVLADLLRRSDVVVENFTSHSRATLGITEAWGLSVKPDLIWASLTSFGRTGPDRDRDGWDLLAQARGGLMSITGNPDGPPMKTGNSNVDYLGGLHLAVAILAAIRHKERTGEGQVVDLSLLDSLIPCMDGFPTWYSIAGTVAQRSGNFHPMRFPGYSVFQCKDGHIAIGAPDGPIWDRLAVAIGRPDLVQRPDVTDPTAWAPFFAKAVAAVTEWTVSRTREEARAALDAHRVPNEPVQDLGEIWGDPQLVARGMFEEYRWRPLGVIRTVASPLRLSRTPVGTRRVPPGPGEHNWEILRDVLGYDEDRIITLLTQSVTESYDD